MRQPVIHCISAMVVHEPSSQSLVQFCEEVGRLPSWAEQTSKLPFLQAPSFSSECSKRTCCWSKKLANFFPEQPKEALSYEHTARCIRVYGSRHEVNLADRLRFRFSLKRVILDREYGNGASLTAPFHLRFQPLHYLPRRIRLALHNQVAELLHVQRRRLKLRS